MEGVSLRDAGHVDHVPRKENDSIPPPNTMRLPPQTLSKYLGRLDELIAEGRAVPVRNVSVPFGGNYVSGETYYKQVKEVGWPEFVEWRTKCQTVLDQIVPRQSAHRQNRGYV